MQQPVNMCMLQPVIDRTQTSLDTSTSLRLSAANHQHSTQVTLHLMAGLQSSPEHIGGSTSLTQRLSNARSGHVDDTHVHQSCTEPASRHQAAPPAMPQPSLSWKSSQKELAN